MKIRFIPLTHKQKILAYFLTAVYFGIRSVVDSYNDDLAWCVVAYAIFIYTIIKTALLVMKEDL